MRVLITGVTGFVGRHLARCCGEAGAEVAGTARRGADPSPEAVSEYVMADLTSAREAAAAVGSVRPDRVFHLAAAASVARSWQDPTAIMTTNVSSTANVLEAVREHAPGCRVLLAGSGEQYGPAKPSELPVTEETHLRPRNPYATSKVMVETLAAFYRDVHGTDIVLTRAFNHVGPGQADTYVVSSFARQLAEAEARGADKVVVKTGNTAIRRDFTDVRDVVRAYWLALERAAAGTYNVCSGSSPAVADILTGLAEHVRLEVEQATDPSLLRAHEVLEIRGSHDKLTEASGWRPEIPLERTLGDTLEWWRTELRGCP